MTITKCGTLKCGGTPKYALSGLLPNGEELAVCNKCYAKFLRKKNKKFNFKERQI